MFTSKKKALRTMSDVQAELVSEAQSISEAQQAIILEQGQIIMTAQERVNIAEEEQNKAKTFIDKVADLFS